MIETRIDVTPPGQSHGLSNAAQFPPQNPRRKCSQIGFEIAASKEMGQLCFGRAALGQAVVSAWHQPVRSEQVHHPL
jgi:hypothetical protein